ncbi:MAG: hypothetical protein U9P80_02105, partial [Thermodesulfobacteriota bacterium]|nr:hypothetical protein [Thermodesulfobacteriota bacterium]
MRNSLIRVFFVLIIAGLGLNACSGSSDNSSASIDFNTLSEGVDAGGYPVGEGILDYYPVSIQIDSPDPAVIIPLSQKTIEITGSLSRDGEPLDRLEKVDLYLNEQPVDLEDNHSFSVIVPVTKDDAPYIPVRFTTFDRSADDMRSDERIVFLQGDTVSDESPGEMDRTIHEYGNGAMI